MTALIYLGVGVILFTLAVAGWFRSAELFTWIFLAWSGAGLFRTFFKWRSMGRSHRLTMVLGCLFALLAAFAADESHTTLKWAEIEREARAALTAADAPPFEFAHVVNNERGIWNDHSPFRGVTLVNFWATWCAPCRAEMPMLGEFAARHDPARVRVVGFTRFYDAKNDAQRREQLARIEAVMRERRAQYPTLVANDDATHSRYRVTILPTSILIGRDQKIAGYAMGVGETKRLLQMAERLAAE